MFDISEIITYVECAACVISAITGIICTIVNIKKR